MTKQTEGCPMSVPAMTFRGGSEARGTWPTGRALLVALLPLAAFVALAFAIDGRATLVMPTRNIIWFALVPLGLVYPFVASIARVRAYAPTTVLMVASIAPALALAGRLLVEPLARDPRGRVILAWPEIWDRVMPPAVIAIAIFVAIEIASAGLRRGPVLGLAGGIVGAAMVGGAGLGLLLVTSMPLQGPV